MTSTDHAAPADKLSPGGTTGPAENTAAGIPAGEFAGFGAVHLNNTSLEDSLAFWTGIVGLELRGRQDGSAELGTAGNTLVVVHEAARNRFREGFSGLYHFAIHVPDEAAFARMLHRLVTLRYPFSPVDHTMSKALYLKDPDGITVELTLETPHRLKRMLTDHGLQAEDADGSIRSVSDRLNIQEVLKALPDKDITTPVPAGTSIGHVHFYAMDLAGQFAFFKKLGFEEFNFLPRYQYADLGAGGAFRHRVAMNTWHGQHRPAAPADNAGLRHLEILYAGQDKLQEALREISYRSYDDGRYWTDDPSGNRLMLG